MVALISRGTELYGLDDSPAVTATNSTPPKEYNAKKRLVEQGREVLSSRKKSSEYVTWAAKNPARIHSRCQEVGPL